MPSLRLSFLLMYLVCVAFVPSSMGLSSSVTVLHMIALPTPGQVKATSRFPPILNCCRRGAKIFTVYYCNAFPGSVVIF